MSRVSSPLTTTDARRVTKKSGEMEPFSDKLSSEDAAFPPRFAQLKKDLDLDKDAIEQAWRSVLMELDAATEEIAQRGSEIIMRVPFEDIKQGLSGKQLRTLKKTGVIIVQGGVHKEEALGWMQSIREYLAANADQPAGRLADDVVFYEVYNAPAQIHARTHPALLETQKFLLSLWHASDPNTEVSMRTPVAYFDRVRIRAPGPAGAVVLGPHLDGGSIERWEDPAFRKCFAQILAGGDAWRAHDPFDITPRLAANMDLYNAPNNCSIFRPWQGWTALSHTGPGEGTLQVLPLLSLATAYILLRPFFRLRPELAAGVTCAEDIPLEADAWVFDTDYPAFPGSIPGGKQVLTPFSHPHLRICKTVVSIPRVEPGDQVYWHTDIVHAVEAEHRGTEASAVIYVPAVPLTERNAAYLRDQRETFLQGLPPPDFPSGEGESKFCGRLTPKAIADTEGRRVLGLQRFEYDSFLGEGEKNAITAANDILAF